MTALSWCCVLAVVVAALLFGGTASAPPPSTSGRTPYGGVRTRSPRRRTGLVLSMTGPLAAGGVGLVIAAVSGAWLPVAAGTVGAVLVTSAVGAVLAP